jgi:hypothetical protein
LLVPFEINQAKLAELKIPAHVADWHRVRILKEIDDFRYDAMVDGNIDLDGESLNALKKIKLFLFYLRDGKDIVKVYDIPFQWYVDTEKSLESFFVTNKITDWKKKFTENRFRLFKNKEDFFFIFIEGKVLDSVKYNPEFGLNKPSAYSSDLMVTRGRLFSDANKNSQNKVDLLNPVAWAGGGITFYIVQDTAKMPLIFNDYAVEGQISKEIIKNIAGNGLTISVLLDAPIKAAIDLPAVACTEENKYPKTVSKITLADPKNNPYSVTIAGKQYYGQWYAKKRVTLENGKSYDYVYSNFPYSQKTPPFTKFDRDRNKRIPSTPTQWYWPQAAGRLFQDYMASLRSANSVEELYDRNSKLKEYEYNDAHGKTMYPFRMDQSVLLEEKWKEFVNFIFNNKKEYSFPLLYPLTLRTGDYRVRNGLLYSDATNYYQLQFIEFPDHIIFLLEDLISLQEAINDLEEAVKLKQVFSSRESLKDTLTNRFYKTSFYQDSTMTAAQVFTHPLSQKPVDHQIYKNELILESIIAWGKATAAIDSFLAPYKTKNDASYAQAYQSYLLGQATIKGADAVAEFEKKLKTGVFYYENGLEYWRPFTALELVLVEQFKKNAAANAKIAEQNKIIEDQNKYYQDQANLAVIQANNVLMTEAQALANKQLKEIADSELAKIQAPTFDYLIQRAVKEGGLPSDILQKWVEENPYYYVRPDLRLAVDKLLAEVTFREQQISTALVADAVSEINFTKALMELFDFKV